MKRLILFTFVIGIFFAEDAMAQATARFTASATIIQPIGITTTADMNFANIDAQNGGAVILTPDNTRISADGAVLAGEDNLSAATFIVTGQPGYTYDITLPQDGHVLTNGIESMIINNFTSSLDNNSLLASESQVLRVGATLNVNPNQTPGFYTTPAPLNVTVNYN